MKKDLKPFNADKKTLKEISTFLSYYIGKDIEVEKIDYIKRSDKKDPNIENIDVYVTSKPVKKKWGK